LHNYCKDYTSGGATLRRAAKGTSDVPQDSGAEDRRSEAFVRDMEVPWAHDPAGQGTGAQVSSARRTESEARSVRQLIFIPLLVPGINLLHYKKRAVTDHPYAYLKLQDC
jgi:hypothetical protein